MARICFCLLLLSLAACGFYDRTDGPCLDHLTVGDRYQITLGEPEFQMTACPRSFDLPPGTELSAYVTAIETDGDACAAGRIEVANFGEWTWMRDPESIRSNGGADLIGEFAASTSDCFGIVLFKG